MPMSPSTPPRGSPGAVAAPNAAPGYPGRGALDEGHARGDFVVRTWQPAPAPDAVAVDALMLGPLAPDAGPGAPPAPADPARADDGLIVRQRPKARGDNIARRKQRAMREDDPHAWFDAADGGPRCAADPVPPGAERARPARWFDPEAPYLQTVPSTDIHAGGGGVRDPARAMTALANGATGVGIIGAPETHRLEVRVSRLEFARHPLMGREDHLASALEEAFRSYKRREAAGLVELYEAKSHAANARAGALRREMAAGSAPHLAGASPAERLAALEEEAEESRRLAIDEGERAAAAVQHMIDLDAAIEEERRSLGARSTSIRFGLRPEPTLSAAGAPDQGPNVPKPEQARRARAAQARFCVALEVNGRVVPGASEARHFRGVGAFSLDVAHAFSLVVSRWPESVRVLVLEKGHVVDALVAAVPVAIPGASPDEPLADAHPRQYQFSAEEPFAPKWSNDGAKEYAGGSLFVACAWTPRDEARGFQTHDDVESRRRELAPPPPPSSAARRAAAAAKVGYADAAGGFGRGAKAYAGPGAPGVVEDATTIPGGVSGAGTTSPGGFASHRTTTSLRASLDPLNPDDAALLETIATRDAVRAAGRGGFRLNVNDELALGHATKATKRQQLLKLRARGEHKLEMPEGGVPLTERDIPDHLLDQTAEDQREHKLLSAQLPGLKEADARAARIADFLQRVKMNVAKGRRRAKQGAKAGRGPVHTDDVVKDAPLPDITFDLTGLFDFLKPVRKLRPVRRRAAPAESHPDRCELVVNIQKAFNLPQRANPAPSAYGQDPADVRRSYGSRQMSRGGYGQQGGDGGGFPGPGGFPGESPELAAFVEVTFQGVTSRTRLASGASPSWQESLVLPFRPPGGDFSPAALQGCEDVVSIVVFDERVEPAEQTYGARGAAASGSSTSKAYLGCVDVPVAALYRADGGKLEGVLPIDQPPVLLGYQPGRGSGNGVQSKPALSVYIQFNPALAKPEPTPTDAGPGEDDATLRHAKNWEKECRAVGRHAKQRPYRALATDAMGRSVLLPRYCAPATLPPGFEGAVADDATLRQLLRFVHLVPHVTDMDAFNLPPGMDIWTTSAEFLDMCAGDSEEHALLMLGFLRQLGVEAYVVLGVSAVDSDAAMVFTPGGQGRRPGRDGQPHSYCALLEDAMIWDPMAGTMFGVYDSAAGALMGEIAVAFDGDNVWGNVQLAARPHEMGWNFNDHAAWRPFFSQATLPPRPLPTVQTTVTYESFPPAFYEKLASAVEREAMDAIVKSRARQHTPFNRRASRALKELLRDLEGHVLMSPEEAAQGVAVPGSAGGRASLTELHRGALGGILEGYAVTGCPIHLPFGDASAIRAAVERTCIAETQRTDVEFAVATHVEPFGCTFVCSTWVYVARLTKRQ